MNFNASTSIMRCIPEENEAVENFQTIFEATINKETQIQAAFTNLNARIGNSFKQKKK